MRCLSFVAGVLCSVGICYAGERQPVTTAAPAARQAGAAADAPLVTIDLKLVETIGGKEHVLSSPRLAMLSGQTAKLEVGNQPSSPDQKFVGTKATVQSIVLTDGRIRAEILLRVSNSGGQVREIDVGYIFRDGQTAVLTAGSSEVKLVATANIVRGDQPNQAPLTR